MAFGFRKLPDSTILNLKQFTYVIGTVANILGVSGVKPKTNSKNGSQAISWRVFKDTLCCMIPEGLAAFRRYDNSFITLGEVKEVLCCITGAGCRATFGVILGTSTIQSQVMGFSTPVTTINTSADIGVSIINAFVAAGLQNPTISVGGTNPYTVAMAATAGDSLKHVLFTIDGKSFLLKACL